MARIAVSGRLPGVTLARLEAAAAPLLRVETLAALRGLPEDARAGLRVLVTSASQGLDAATLAALPALDFVASFGAGQDRLDLEAAAARGVAVRSVGDYLTEDVADLVFAFALSLGRDLPAADRFVREGLWATRRWGLGRGLTGRCMGILGFGRIGRAVARRAEGFGMRIAVHARNPVAGRDWHPTPLALAEAADILVLCCPGGPATRGIIGAAELRALGPEGLLINVARGSVVQEEALIAALEAGAIAGAGLDVFENEPTPDPRFAALRNVALSPHIGGSTREARARADAMMTETVLAHLGIA